MMACYVHRDGGYTLISDSGAVIGTLIDLEEQTPIQKLKHHQKPTEWFRIDGCKTLAKHIKQKGA